MKFLRIIFFLLKKKNYLVILKKLIDKFEINKSEAAIKWVNNQNPFFIDSWMEKVDYELYIETKRECKILKRDAEKILSKNLFWQNLIKANNAGGASYDLLYFLTKQKKPNVIVETGVAAGWSSLAFLRASKNNDNGKIFSSDLPYFKEKDAEKNIGILIKNEQNKDKLKLFISGDQINLQLIIKQLQHNKIDLLHYDSDKSYSGRNLFLKSLKHYFSDDAILIFDDIHNNLHFKDFVENNNLKYTVFKNYVGLVDFSAQ